MSIHEGRKPFHSVPAIGLVFRKNSATEYLNAHVNDDEFEATEIFASAGTREIMAIFKAGEKYTPEDRSFDFYFPVKIETGIYPLAAGLEIAFTEYVPQQHSTHQYFTYFAHSGDLNIFVNTQKTVYSGSFSARFNNKVGEEISASGTFGFLIG
ncbi:hypothetical protein PHLH6_46930 [Pseudomonas sp. Seg1]|uniref:hypothetical protein n=1 Tax=Pseudomonas sp. Seg1 TaxID=2678259 RepID=UPI001BB3E3B2|nr:hypothetical protein [Pseudomonas sp. Seg1]BBP72689.1 hypothetical protein PHLH6_46930 [Pseudomonas sp. Seg1]